MCQTCFALEVPFNTGGIVQTNNYTNNEICYLKYYGVAIYDTLGNKAYGLKEKMNVTATPFISGGGFKKMVGSKVEFYRILEQSDLHNYDNKTDYCGLLRTAIERKVSYLKSINYYNSKESLSNTYHTAGGDTEDVAELHARSEVSTLERCYNTRCAHTATCLNVERVCDECNDQAGCEVSGLSFDKNKKCKWCVGVIAIRECSIWGGIKQCN